MEWKFLPEDKSGSARKSRDYRLFIERVIKSAQLLEKSLSEYIVREDEDLNTNKLLKETREIIALSDDPVHTFRMLRRVRRYDDLTYIHSLEFPHQKQEALLHVVSYDLMLHHYHPS